VANTTLIDLGVHAVLGAGHKLRILFAREVEQDRDLLEIVAIDVVETKPLARKRQVQFVPSDGFCSLGEQRTKAL